MKITSLDLHAVDIPDRAWGWPDEAFGMPLHRKDLMAFILIRTDERVDEVGAVGLYCGPPKGESEVDTWPGRDPMRVNLALLDTPPANRKAFKSAILDIRGKVLGCPISEWMLSRNTGMRG